jgi:hypothetical protein
MADGERPQRGSLNEWWKSRSIPASRSGLRDALERLDVGSTGSLLLKCMGLSLSDQYWVCPHDSSLDSSPASSNDSSRDSSPTNPRGSSLTIPQSKALRWEDINFFDNEFSGDVGNALFGHGPSGKSINLVSPDNTSDGWLQKKWAIADGKRVLMKCGSAPCHQEPLNEVLATLIMKRLGIPHVAYSLAFEDDRPISVCEDFIDSTTDLVSAWSIYNTLKKSNNDSVYTHYIRCTRELGIPDVTQQLNAMLLVDYIIANEDRHFNNFGCVRDAETLRWMGAAPVFDSGTSMYHNQLPSHINPASPGKSKPFAADHGKQIKLIGGLDWFDPHTLDGIAQEWAPILKASPFIEDDRYDALLKALEYRVGTLSALI